tara:strand:+ start:1314 stop:2615 length:1302 start_codon:yes stop_codon:yes gene_type:complete
MSELNLDQLCQALEAVERYGSVAKAAKVLGLPRTTLRDRVAQAKRELVDRQGNLKECVKTTETDATLTVSYVGKKIVTIEDLIKDIDIDMNVFEIDRVDSTNWEVGGKLKDSLWKMPLRRIRAVFRRKSDERLALENLLELVEENSPVVPRIKYKKPSKKISKRSLEISICDPHLGLNCYPPECQDAYSLDDCEQLFMWAIDNLIDQSSRYENITEIVFPFGNDFLHVDNVAHTTTAGTAQAESLPWHYIYLRGEQLAIAAIERLKQVAPVKILSVPGNHDRQSVYTLARVLNAYYRNDPNVNVDASAKPYKFYRFGCNLIGFEHGHSINALRLASIMANEAPQDWSETAGGWREWHLGDQHRKGTGKPAMFEEQGVSVEYLPGLTANNAWHTVKGFTWQKRGAMAFIWDQEQGPIARLQCNLNNYTGGPMGR